MAVSPTMKKANLSISLSRDEKAELLRYCAAVDLSASQYVRRLVRMDEENRRPGVDRLAAKRG